MNRKIKENKGDFFLPSKKRFFGSSIVKFKESFRKIKEIFFVFKKKCFDPSIQKFRKVLRKIKLKYFLNFLGSFYKKTKYFAPINRKIKDCFKENKGDFFGLQKKKNVLIHQKKNSGKFKRN